MHAVGYKGAIPDMIINMIFKWGEENSKGTPISIKSEPRKPLLALVLDMFMFQLQHVKEPPTDDIFVWAPVCVCVCVYVQAWILNQCSSWEDGFLFTFFFLLI